ncbi:MAG: YhcH/YjgK/YiaL family protein [Paludibacteraceae bacterium]|nr:YhcH/YjgK/YiaL family protein [Paludibacteraceae bacterium]MBQ9705201.1 YhcH/YjgK/YiaL family protein [Paludibacteraceae bacterium]
MILDKLENLEDYELGGLFGRAIAFLRDNDLQSLPACKIKVQGDDLVVNIQDFAGKEEADCRMEAHRDFADIQIVLGDGEERMGWKAQDDCKEVLTAYNEEKDVEFYKDKADSFVTVHAGQAAIFFPTDAHQPGIAPGRHYRKVIVKVKVR